MIYQRICWDITTTRKDHNEGETIYMGREQTNALEELKASLVGTPILVYPNWSKEFHISVDASNFFIRATLAQAGTEGLDHPIFFAGRLAFENKRNYSTTEREVLGMVYLVQKFQHYLLATPFTFSVDH